MPSKPVVQNTCERCTRVWYTEKSAEVKLELKAELGDEKFAAKYECLCEGCTKTVTSLLKSIAKEFKPRAPRAKKKDESTDQDKSQPADHKVTPLSAPSAPPPAVSDVAVAPVGAPASAIGTRVTQPAAASQHPKSR